MDTGKYNLDQEKYDALVREMCAKSPPITLTSEYADWITTNQLQFLVRLARYKFVAKMIKKTDRVLEVGSGSGLGSIFLAQHCAHVKGIEVKTTEVEQAKSLNRRKNVEFIAGDLFDWPKSRSYDVVVGLDVIEHMEIEDGRRLLDAMIGQLNDTGMLIIGSPSIYSYPYQSPLSHASHVKCYDREELVELVDGFCGRTIAFSMNDEIVHTGNPKMAWYYFVLGFMPKLP